MDMKKYLLFAAALITAFSCAKNNQPSTPEEPSKKPVITWEAYPTFTAEFMPTMDAVVTVSAPEGLDVLTIKSVATNPDYVNVFAKTYIGVSQNRASGNIVFDLIDDATVASNFVEKQICTSAGTTLRGNTGTLNLNFLKLIEILTDSQDIENDTNIAFEISVTDALGDAVSQTIKFHFTAAPAFDWANTVSTTVVPLDNYKDYATVTVTAPALIKSVSLLVSSESAGFNQWLDVRATKEEDGSINVLNEENNANIKLWSTNPLDQKEAVLNFSELLSNLLIYAKSEESSGITYEFLITVKDGLDKTSSLRMKFKK